ncbi:hypothetical protein QN360_20770, partial [Glaciimonas sp. CA11.2]|uniref:hypothetical protein n=1 Tax=Glaciimonas sp. CA11.2 TaxID=3048601 RepID=UPI002B23535E
RYTGNSFFEGVKDLAIKRAFKNMAHVPSGHRQKKLLIFRKVKSTKLAKIQTTHHHALQTITNPSRRIRAIFEQITLCSL